MPFGCLDRRLVSPSRLCLRRFLHSCSLPVSSPQGTSDKTSTCETCGQKMAFCAGHFGHVSLVLPVFHVGYAKAILATLQRICKVSGSCCPTT